MLTTPWHIWMSDYAGLIEIGLFLTLIFSINFFLKRAILRFQRRKSSCGSNYFAVGREKGRPI